ncbi:MAG: 5-(carboxyamino)imidazole ribonucleotide mutase [Candidatus Omnitrophica bacterium]|nr:5-(carboxyamino)imidazole ribonucleotide mutase [Candidatus Omnitrophota bacterium]MCM8793509.1 5-(carboxyamino)imidazole ribonucleotide mutase [Candidatus Omnitrophota bacterium]
MKKSACALVSVVMGSDSDLEIVESALEILKAFKIPYEVRIISAHRTPEEAIDFAKTAKDRGIKVIIAAAGGAAHLPGVIASHTELPVIGIPVETEALKGIDSLLSIVQMPAGIPVGTMALGKAGAKNSALYALRILALGDKKLNPLIIKYKKKMRKKVKDRDREVRKRYSFYPQG